MDKLSYIREYLNGYDGRALKIMEVCGTHTASVFRYGIRSLLSPKIRLVSGPGCPVCVTAPAYIDAAVSLSLREGLRVYSFGDMFKVPGSDKSLAGARADGGSCELIYSPFSLIERAKEEPGLIHIICAVGFETTAPVYAQLLMEAEKEGLSNIRLLSALKLTLPAIERICEIEPDIAAFLCPGHVSVITGSDVYKSLCERYNKPFIVAGFSAEELLTALYEIVSELEAGSPKARNFYPSVVKPEGNQKALSAIDEVFERGTALWRGLGSLPSSGLYLRSEYSKYDARELLDSEQVSSLSEGIEKMPEGCRCSDVILGRIDPPECPLFKSGSCTAERPVGPCMVSSEGSCGIWYGNSL